MIRALARIPDLLVSLPQPPKALFFEGNPELLMRPKVAIVGTRRPCGYTKALTAQLSRELSAAGAVIVSGGAMGVDAIAHENAMPNTIAVLAGSLDVGFVRTNRTLIDRIRREGLLLSEYESGVHPKPWSFVHRNRLVSALSDRVVVMEADIKSGSMSTAGYALNQNKKLYVPPHRLGESAGTNNLLATHQAQMLLSAQQLIRELDLGSSARPCLDELLQFCLTRPTYEAAYARYGARLVEYELMGRVHISEGHVEVCRGDTGD